ncbi:hypothetical protein BC831DRAFT_451184 [Entophlyctis helioformis]|nr:hypothetical protein BC831DRAFT_485392 [Entophlyctis helioformis]KAI8927821.1 hypothetical protein BC831DRAFT_451184 [Entophlyctis helioformis]
MIVPLAAVAAVVLGSQRVASQPSPANYPPADRVAPPNSFWNAAMLGSLPPSPDGLRCTNGDDWAMTFDDGPSPNTAVILDALRARNIKATFFVVGSRVLQYPDVLLRTFQEGHEIALHTWSHADLATLTDDQVIAEILYNAQIVREVIGVTPRILRPPYGSVNDRVRTIITNLGLVIALWSFDSLDSVGGTTVGELTAQRAALRPRIGTISLQHDLLPAAVNQAPPAMDAVVAQGHTTVTISACIGQPAYDETLFVVRAPIVRNVTLTATTTPLAATATASVNGTVPTTAATTAPPTRANTTATGVMPAAPPSVATPTLRSGDAGTTHSVLASTAALFATICSAFMLF